MSATTARLIQARTAAGFETADAAAIALGLLNETYRLHETGRHKTRPAELRRYAEAFGVSVGWLSTGVGQGPR